MSTAETLKKLSELAEQKSAATTIFIDRVVTVSTSALAFSMTFRSSIIGTSPSHIWLLKVAWIAFGICSVFGVLLHLATPSAIKRLIRDMRDGDVVGSAAGCAHPVYDLIYRLLVIAFPLGIFSLMAFGVLNTH
jgi:uncharacterized membrane protein (Fun14 family)